MKKEIVIVGGGASGLMAAITCLRQGKKVLILEQKDKVGKKILATGNGKCNFTNIFQEDSCYRSSQAAFPGKALQQFGAEDTVRFFEDLGVLVKERNGYLYPYSGQASTILDALYYEAKRLGVEIECGIKVDHIKKEKGAFKLQYGGKTMEAETVILSAGGKASKALGSDGSGFGLAKELGHHTTKLCPSLTGLKVKENFCKALAGVRTDAAVSLFIEDSYVTKDVGELQLTSYGVSGIPVFQICRFAGMALLEKKEVEVKVDFFPNWKEKQLRKLVFRQKERFGKEAAQIVLAGLLNKKVLLVLLKQAGIQPETILNKVSDEKLLSLCKNAKALAFHVIETNGFENAQVCAGGIDTREVNGDTMESKLVKRLYFAGEILDVDGICGGYNLQWAWASGFVAGSHAAKR
ncbi:BaiN/RdsA family NAD(P)/FAD-dependent oxidoreductase [[Clostridium] polysaccharolyticum]|uniref:Flavoprotein, HI0933 family n=1 Tax=[Clostridium] polysaccharolyticum TaxID=29364 RepID=A0A1I0ATW2_9FIRM|nr:NAD(P)/FAD-dependent oxidoreductase [[Clostridium] polysaccharolyticum]SES97813.1 hypothetical protein SAMN04487772_10640 [[Clostridium] polysaccharolyticum]